MRLTRARPGKWLLCLGVSCCALVITFWPGGLLLFRYDRAVVFSGQEWRLLTAHLVHLNTAHLFFNLIGLFLLAELLWGELAWLHGLGLLLITSIGISLSLWFLDPGLIWYGGLSGSLHGLWAACALAGVWRDPKSRHVRSDASTAGYMLSPRSICFIGLLLLGIKLAIEFHSGASSRTEQIIGAPVITSAHRYGALIGIVYILIWRLVALLRKENNV